MFFVISLSLYGTSIPRKYSIGIQQLNLLPFRKIFPQKTMRLGALSGDREKWQKIVRLTAKPWELADLRCSRLLLLVDIQSKQLPKRSETTVPRFNSSTSAQRISSSTSWVESETMLGTDEHPSPPAPPPQAFSFPLTFSVRSAMVCREDIMSYWKFFKQQWQD